MMDWLYNGKDVDVYGLEEEGSGYIKQGSTAQEMSLRLHDHQFANPRRLIIVGHRVGSRVQEGKILKLLRPWRLNLGGGRDWFDLPPDVKTMWAMFHQKKMNWREFRWEVTKFE
jgi:cell division FtsZ-interacting protein ZapD